MGFSMLALSGVYFANPGSKGYRDRRRTAASRMNMEKIHTIGSLGYRSKFSCLTIMPDGMVRTIQAVFYDRQFTGSERNTDANFANIAKECGFKWCRKISKREEPGTCNERVPCRRRPLFSSKWSPTAKEGVYPVIPRARVIRTCSRTVYQGSDDKLTYNLQPRLRSNAY